MQFLGFDHVQIAMPRAEEAAARHFYGVVLGLTEIEKPENVQTRGGCWFETEHVQIHLGVQSEFVPARKAHPGFLISDLDALSARLSEFGYTLALDTSVPGRRRGHLFDPFGNRLELIQDGDGFSQRPEGTS